MFERTRYLEWASRHYGKVRFDLATSGIAGIPLESLATPPATSLDDPSGWEKLHGAIAKYNDVPKNEAVAALGTTHALWLAYASLTSPGDVVLVESPVYEPLLRIAEGVGARIESFAREPSERFRLDPGRVARAMTPQTRAVVITNLHNPSGVRASDDALRETARVAEAHGAYLVVDEVYAPFDELVDGQGIFRASARKLAPNVVAVSSLTKCYGLGAHRIGWLLGPPSIAERAVHAVTATCGALPLVHAHTALRAFADIVRLANRTRATLGAKRRRVATWVETHGWTWSSPEEGLFGFVVVPGAGDLTPVIEAAAHEREVLVAPGSFFGVPNGFRVAWSAAPDVVDEGLERLAGALSAAAALRGG
jgi:aspartate/methionine/tyrosine aminotransferase